MIIHIDSSVLNRKDFFNLFAEFNGGFCGRSLDAVHDVLTEHSENFEVVLGTATLKRIFGERYKIVVRMFADSAYENPYMKLTVTND